MHGTCCGMVVPLTKDVLGKRFSVQTSGRACARVTVCVLSFYSQELRGWNV